MRVETGHSLNSYIFHFFLFFISKEVENYVVTTRYWCMGAKYIIYMNYIWTTMLDNEMMNLFWTFYLLVSCKRLKHFFVKKKNRVNHLFSPEVSYSNSFTQFFNFDLVPHIISIKTYLFPVRKIETHISINESLAWFKWFELISS